MTDLLPFVAAVALCVLLMGLILWALEQRPTAGSFTRHQDFEARREQLRRLKQRVDRERGFLDEPPAA